MVKVRSWIFWKKFKFYGTLDWSARKPTISQNKNLRNTAIGYRDMC